MSKRASISRMDVFTVANELSDSGKPPTAGSIREKLGQGSYTTIQRHLDEWRKETSAGAADIQVPVELQRFLGTFMTELWQLAQQQAQAALQEERQRLESEQATLMKKVDEALTAREVIQESLTSYQYELKQSQQRYQQSQKELALARQEATNHLRDRQRADERTDELETLNERLQSKLQALEVERERLDTSEKACRSRAAEYQAQLTHQQEAATRLNDQLDQLSVAHRAALNELEVERSNAQRAREERSDMERETTLAQHQLKDLQTRYDKLQKSHREVINVSAANEAQATQLQQQLDNELATLTQLQSDMEQLQQTHYQLTGQLTTVKDELRYAQRMLYRLGKDEHEQGD